MILDNRAGRNCAGALCNVHQRSGLAGLAGSWPGQRLEAIWNSLKLELPKRLGWELSDRWLPRGGSVAEHHFCHATHRAANQNVGNDCQSHCRK